MNKNGRTRKDNIGESYNHFTIIGRMRHNGRLQWKCKCSCGSITPQVLCKLRLNIVKSCGCQIRNRMKGNTYGLSHGHARGGKTSPTYNTWSSMLKRCYLKSHIAYARYGGRGILVCTRWHKFENFLKDMGIRPINTSLDRIDNDKGYLKSNCRWATRLEQSHNKRKRIICKKEQS